MLPDPNPALTLPSLARSPDLAAEPQAPFGTTAARYFAAHRPHPVPSLHVEPPLTPKHPSLAGLSCFLSCFAIFFVRTFRVYLGRGGQQQMEVQTPIQCMQPTSMPDTCPSSPQFQPDPFPTLCMSGGLTRHESACYPGHGSSGGWLG